MKQILFAITFLITATVISAQITVVGDTVKRTVPARVETKGVEEAFDEATRDTANMKRYILELQGLLANHQLILNNRVAEIQLMKTRAGELRGKRELREFLQGNWILERTVNSVVTSFNVTIVNQKITNGGRSGTITPVDATTATLTGFFTGSVNLVKTGETMVGTNIVLKKP